MNLSCPECGGNIKLNDDIVYYNTYGITHCPFCGKFLYLNYKCSTGEHHFVKYIPLKHSRLWILGWLVAIASLPFCIFNFKELVKEKAFWATKEDVAEWKKQFELLD